MEVDVESSFAFSVQRRTGVVGQVVLVGGNGSDFDVEDFFLQNFGSEKRWKFGVDFVDRVCVEFQSICSAEKNIKMV